MRYSSMPLEWDCLFHLPKYLTLVILDLLWLILPSWQDIRCKIGKNGKASSGTLSPSHTLLQKNLATFINYTKTQNLAAWRSIFPTQHFSCLEKLCCIATLIISVTLNTIIHNICVHSQCDQWELIFHSQDKLSSSRMKASVSMMYKHVFPFGLRETSSKQGIRNGGITAKLPLVRNQLLAIYLPVAKELYPR